MAVGSAQNSRNRSKVGHLARLAPRKRGGGSCKALERRRVRVCGGGYNLPSHGPDQNIQNNAIAKREMSDGISKTDTVQPAVIGWPTGNGKKRSNSQACCLAKLCLAGA